MPPDGGVLAVGQQFDVRVEAENDAADAADAPRGLVVLINGREVTAQNLLEPGSDGERGAGGTGAARPELPARDRAAPGVPSHHQLSAAPLCGHVGRTAADRGAHRGWRHRPIAPDRGGLERRGRANGAGAQHHRAARRRHGGRAPHRGADRVARPAQRQGRGPLAMDTLDVTGMVMTAALNSAITDSSPGMSAYSTGQKPNNNQEGRVSRQHAGPLRQSAHRIHRRAAQADARRRLQRRHRHDRGPHRFDAGGERRAHVRLATRAPALPRSSSTSARPTASRC